MITTRTIALLLILLIPTVASVSAQDDALVERWSTDAFAGFATPSGRDISGDLLVYQFYEERTFAALDLTTGDELWRVEVTGQDERGDALMPRKDPVIHGDVVFLENSAFTFSAVDAATGEELWAADVDPGTVWQSPVPLDEATILTANGDTLYRMDARDGSVAWESTMPFTAYRAGHEGINTIAASDTHALVVTSEGRIISADLATGDVVWNTQLPSDLPVALHGVQDGTHLIVQDNMLYAFDEEEGLLWDTDAEGLGSRSTLAGDVLIFIGITGVTAIDIRTGESAWELAGVGNSAATIVDGKVLVQGCEMGSLVGIDLATGDELWSVEQEYRCALSATEGGVLVETLEPEAKQMMLLNAQTGEQAWDEPLDVTTWPPPYTIIGMAILVFGRDGTLTMYDLA